MTRALRLFLPFVLLLNAANLFSAPVSQQELTTMNFDQALDYLMNMNLDVTGSKTTTREAPSIVTVITDKDIAAIGARDLIDVLRLVPGFEFGTDINSIIGLGIRGNWAHEGKFLLLLDGQVMNEPLYGTNEFGNHFPVDQIKQIEIIRGPGSAIYGGYAELAVISIKTKSAKDIDGASTTLTYGQMNAAYARRNAQVSFGKASGDLEVTAHAFYGQSNASDQDYTSYVGGALGNTYNFKDNSTHNPNMVNFDMKYKGVDVRYISDEFRSMQRDYWGPSFPRPMHNDFDTAILNAQYDWKLSDNLTLTPRFNRKEGTSYHRFGQGVDNVLLEGAALPDDKRFEVTYLRQTESVDAQYDFGNKSNVIFGGEAYQDQAEYIKPTLTNGGYNLYFNNLALYAQGLWNNPIVNVTVGGRYENHSQFGSSFVPRVALTKVLDRWHFKLMYDNAFKVPTIENIRLNPNIKPEKSDIKEFEAGYMLTNDMFITANVFDIVMRDAIVYTTTLAGDDFYDNFGKTGTQGVELEYKYLKNWGMVDLTYSYSKVNNNEVAFYTVPGKDDILLGLPAQKLTLDAQYRLGKFSFCPTAIYFTERYGMDAAGTAAIKYDPAVLVNFFVNYKPITPLTIGLGVYDIGNTKPLIIQPYNGGHAPIPGTSREYLAKVTYDVKF